MNYSDFMQNNTKVVSTIRMIFLLLLSLLLLSLLLSLLLLLLLFSFGIHFFLSPCNVHLDFIWLIFFSVSVNEELHLQGTEQLSWLNYQAVFISCLTLNILLPLPWAKWQVLMEKILQDLSELFITPIQ